MPVARALLSRRSVRGFLPTPVAREAIEGVLYLAARAPSGTNCQPWKVYVCTGAVRDALSAELHTAHDAQAAGATEYTQEYEYYPRHLAGTVPRPEAPDRLGLLRTDGHRARRPRASARAARARTYDFFGAPVGLFFTLDRDLEMGSWLDTGMFVQGVMTAARAYGLHTIPQAAFLAFHRIVRRHLGIPDGEILLCGMALGYIDESAPENALNTEREPVSGFARFLP